MLALIFTSYQFYINCLILTSSSASQVEKINLHLIYTLKISPKMAAFSSPEMSSFPRVLSIKNTVCAGRRELTLSLMSA